MFAQPLHQNRVKNNQFYSPFNTFPSEWNQLSQSSYQPEEKVQQEKKRRQPQSQQQSQQQLKREQEQEQEQEQEEEEEENQNQKDYYHHHHHHHHHRSEEIKGLLQSQPQKYIHPSLSSSMSATNINIPSTPTKISSSNLEETLTRFNLVKHFYTSSFDTHRNNMEGCFWVDWDTDCSIVNENAEVYPVLRAKSRNNRFARVLMDHIPIIIGNQLPLMSDYEGIGMDIDNNNNNNNNKIRIDHQLYLSSISLRQYLEHFSEYISSDIYKYHISNIASSSSSSSSPTENINDINYKSQQHGFKLLCDNDNYVLIQTQCAIIDVVHQAQRFCPIYYQKHNTQSHQRAVLVIVATPLGTSAQILEEEEMVCCFNYHGFKADFLRHELMLVIEVPLKQLHKISYDDLADEHDIKSDKQQQQQQGIISSWTRLFSLYNLISRSGASTSTGSNTTGSKEEIKIKKELPTADAQCQQWINVRSTRLCICRQALKGGPAKECYENTGVSCDGCGHRIEDIEIVWHCPAGKNNMHGDGFDLCDQCSLRQLEFDELRGEIIGAIRDETLPIAVTVHYTKMTPSGVLNDKSLPVIADLLFTSKVRPRPTNVLLDWNHQIYYLPVLSLPISYTARFGDGTTNTSGHDDNTSLDKFSVKNNELVSDFDTNLSNTANVTNTTNPIATSTSTSSSSSSTSASASLLSPKNTTTKINLSFERSNVLIKRILKALDMKEYVKVFITNEVYDTDLLFLRTQDVDALIDKIGPRARFSAWINQFQMQNRDNIKALKGQLTNL